MTNNCCIQFVVLEKTLESPLDSKEIKPVNPKGINPEYLLEGLMLKQKLQCFGHLMQRADSLEKTGMLRKTEGKETRGQHMMRWIASLTQWTRTGESSGRYRKTGEPGVLQSMESQRVRHDLVTEQQ